MLMRSDQQIDHAVRLLKDIGDDAAHARDGIRLSENNAAIELNVKKRFVLIGIIDARVEDISMIDSPSAATASALAPLAAFAAGEPA